VRRVQGTLVTTSFRVSLTLMIFQAGVNQYLADLEDTPSGVRTLKDLIAFNEEHEKEELPLGWTDIDTSKYTYFTMLHSSPDSYSYSAMLLSRLKEHSWTKTIIGPWNGAGAWPETRVSTPH